ncbi:hypothetical protein ACWIID_35625 [Streptomyces phaeochromogenes]
MATLLGQRHSEAHQGGAGELFEPVDMPLVVGIAVNAPLLTEETVEGESGQEEE